MQKAVTLISDLSPLSRMFLNEQISFLEVAPTWSNTSKVFVTPLFTFAAVTSPP